MFENYSSDSTSIFHGLRKRRKAVKIDVINDTNSATKTHTGNPNIINSISSGQYQGMARINSNR
jgi:hypothetical protein